MLISVRTLTNRGERNAMVGVKVRFDVTGDAVAEEVEGAGEVERSSRTASSGYIHR
jgi:hypothetical protein